MFYPSRLLWVKDFSQREKQWLERRILKQLSSILYLVKVNRHESYVKKHVDQLRYQPIFEIDKNPFQNKVAIA